MIYTRKSTANKNNRYNYRDKCRDKFRKAIIEYVSKAFDKNSSQYKSILNLELSKIDQQNKIQIPFILRYYNKKNKNVRLNNAKLLDIGCGTGGATVAWSLRGADCIGIDISEEDLKIAKLRSECENLNSKSAPRFMKFNGKKLPFKNTSFDIIICDQVLEHVPSFQDMVTEMRRVAKKDAVVYIDLPNKFFVFENHYRVFFAHWFPKPVHKFIVKLAGRKYFDYPVFFRSYFEIKRAILDNDFAILATSKDYIRTLENRGLKNKAAKILNRLGVPFYLFSPTLQFIIRPK